MKHREARRMLRHLKGPRAHEPPIICQRKRFETHFLQTIEESNRYFQELSISYYYSRFILQLSPITAVDRSTLWTVFCLPNRLRRVSDFLIV